MKLLLTSAGFTNPSIIAALRNCVKGDIKIAFIPTAANMSSSDKHWLVKDLVACAALGSLDIVDIAAVKKSVWLPRLKAANVIVIGGGDTTYLMKCVKKSGLKKELPSLLKNRVYVGISAGSIITNKTLCASSDFLYGDESSKAPKGLGYVDFAIRPHLNSKHFPKVIDKHLRKSTHQIDTDLYAIDDESAILWINGTMTMVSKGYWKKYALAR